MVDRKGKSKPVDTIKVEAWPGEKEVIISANSIDVPLASIGLSANEMDQLAIQWCRERKIDPRYYLAPVAKDQCAATVLDPIGKMRCCKNANGQGKDGMFCWRHA